MNRKNLHVLFLILITVGTVIALLFSIFGAASMADRTIDIVILCLIVLCVLLPYFFGYGKTRAIKAEFDRATAYLREQGNVSPAEVRLLFKNEDISAAFGQYCHAMETQPAAEGLVISDINDYINEDYIDLVTRKDTAEQVSGALTGLGILGTFIGLSIGLAQFRLGENVDTLQMQSNISELMNGIRAAFYTSIFGVGYSIVTNFFMKLFYENTYESMKMFVSEYESHAASFAQDNVLTNLISNQKAQTELLSSFANDIAIAFASQMQITLTPVIEKLNSSIDSFIEHSVKTHDESLKSVVDAFVSSMNASLGEQFSELGITLSQLNEEQRKSGEMLCEVTTSICQNAVNLNAINDMLLHSLDQMSGYMDKLQEYQTNITEANHTLLGQVIAIGSLSEKQAGALELLNEQQHEVCAAVQTISKTLTQYHETAEIIKESTAASCTQLEQTIAEVFIALDKTIADTNQAALEQNREMMKAVQEITLSSNHAIEEQAELTKIALDEVVAQTKLAIEALDHNSSEQNALIAESFARSIEQSSEILQTEMQKANEIAEQLNIHMNRSAETLSKAYQELEDDIARVLRNTFDSFDQQISQMAQHFSGTLKQSDATITHMDKYMQEAPMRLYEVLNTTITEMNKSVSELTAARVNAEKALHTAQDKR